MADVCDVPVISGVCDVAGEAAGSLVAVPFDWLAQGMGHAAGWMFEAVWKVFDSTTLVDVTSSQYTRVYDILFGVAVFVMLGFFMLQVIMKGPVAVMMVVSLSSRPVLNRAVVKEIGALVSC